MEINDVNKISGYIFPLFIYSRFSRNIKLEKYIGTGFLIGSNSFALTAAHVVEAINHNDLIALFPTNENNWIEVFIADYEIHPSEDVSIIKFASKLNASPLIISNEKHFGIKEYFSYGYPSSTLYENPNLKNYDGSLSPFPDLVCTKGYIRRRINLNIELVRGSKFHELNTVSGWGYSGSPLISHENMNWYVIGIYSAQQIFYEPNDDDSVKYIDSAVGYAVRSDSIYDWIPNILGKTIQNESII